MAGTRMQQRRGTAAEWAAANPVLTAGELGVETDTGVIKFGNGTSTWNQLSIALGSSYLPILGKAYDSERLDGLDSTAFLKTTDADSAATANKVAKRDVSGNINYNRVFAAQAPSSASELTRKDYADARETAAKTYADGLVDFHNWELTDGNGQAIAHNTNTSYVPTSFPTVYGVTRSAGVITITKAGLYLVAAGTRFNAGGSSAERYMSINQLRNSVVIARVEDNDVSIGAVTLSATRLFRANVGDQFYVNLFQLSTVSLNINNASGSLFFSGVYLRP